MKAVFYITNHGFGHASRNVPIINMLVSSGDLVAVKSDERICSFLKRNLSSSRISYHTDCRDVVLILKEGSAIPDEDAMLKAIAADKAQWPDLISREKDFLSSFAPDIVVCDVMAWPLKAASELGIPTLLIGNFSWAEMYRSFYPEEVYSHYLSCYRLADKALWYEIHSPELHEYCSDYECISLVSRAHDDKVIESIRNSTSLPKIFVSLGASVDLASPVDVSALPYTFYVTRGIKLLGDNVVELPLDMVNTPDYIRACDYVIAKGGWSTVAEILLAGRKSALLVRGSNIEDQITTEVLTSRSQAVMIREEDLTDIGDLISRIDSLKGENYDIYHDDTAYICSIIKRMTSDNQEEL